MIILLCVVFKSHSQVFYSTNTKYLKSKTEQNNILSDYKFSYPDTSITEQANFFPRNFRGNLGLASPNYIWTYGTDDIGFRFLEPPYKIDQVTEKDVTYFRSQGPYASLNGIAGPKQYQSFRALFTHTYRDKVNVTIKFNRYTSTGFYKKQQTYTNNFYLSSNYTTKKKNAGYYFYILNNGNKSEENGGIKDSALTDSSMIYAKELFKYKLSDARRENRELKVMINPWIRLNQRNDSTAKVDHYIQLKSKFSNSSFRYRDVGIRIDSFYTAAYFDTLKTIDSSHVRKFTNELSYSLLSRNNKFGFSAGYKNEINQTWQYIDSFFVNHILQSDLVFRTKISPKDSLNKNGKYFETRFNLQYILNGPGQGDYKAENNSVFTFDERRKRNFFLDLLYENRSPDYMYNNWASNHFLWLNNGYKQQQQMQARFGINLNRFLSASVFYQGITNYLYFDQQALARQYSGSITNLGLNLDFTKIFFKHLGIGLNHIYQKTSNKTYVRVPENVSTAKLFFNANLAKNNLQLQIGGQIQVYESFTSYGYMPSTQVFYLQNDFKTESYYPYVDAYLSARIRPVSFFLKVENVLQSLAGPNYAFVPGYYQTDLAFRFGLTWVFFD